MKVVVTGTRGFPGIQGGVENHCEKLYTHLADLGCDITVFSRKPYVTIHREKYKGVTLIPLDCPKNKFLEAIVHTWKSVLKARYLKPDILHIHAIGPSLFVPLARALGMKVVVTHHGPDYKRKKWTLPAKIFLKICERMGMMFSNEIITIAKNISDDIRMKYGRSSAIIPNGVDIPQLSETSDYLTKSGLEKKKYVLSVGRFVPEKGFHDLIEAFNRGEFRGWKLVLVGDADHEDDYSRTLKAQAKKSSNVLLTGFLSGQPLHELYSHAGLFVLASYYEGLPIVLLEAMSYGLSCLASRIPANINIELREDRFFEAGENGLLASKIKQYMVSPWQEGEKEEMLELIRTKYSWVKIASDTLRVYQKI